MLSDPFRNSLDFSLTAVLSLSHFSPHTQTLKELIRVEVEIYIVACDRKCECTVLELDTVFLLV